MYTPEHFKLYEFLPKDFYEKWYPKRGEKLWCLFDDRLLVTADNIRERYGRISVNTWYWGGNTQYRGFRPPSCSVGVILSQHRFGRAVDLEPHKVPAWKIRTDILGDTWNEDFKYITGLELSVSWLHIDVRNWDKKNFSILTFKP